MKIQISYEKKDGKSVVRVESDNDIEAARLGREIGGLQAAFYKFMSEVDTRAAYGVYDRNQDIHDEGQHRRGPTTGELEINVVYDHRNFQQETV